MIKNDEFEKGNVINVARIAGIMGAKHTSSLIPLCHNITLDSSDINFKFLEEELEIVSTVKSEENWSRDGSTNCCYCFCSYNL